jgi:hypothetical protein
LNSTKSKENDVVIEILNDNKKIPGKGINFMKNVDEKMDIYVDSNAPFNYNYTTLP